MIEERDPKRELKNCGMFALRAIGLALLGGVMLVASTALGRVYPVVAIVSGAAILFGGLGVLLAILMTIYWLFQLRSGGGDRAPSQPIVPIYGATSRPRQLMTSAPPRPVPAQPPSPPPTPVRQMPPPRPSPHLGHEQQIPRREMPPVRPQPAPRQPDRIPAPNPAVPPAQHQPPLPLDERPTVVPRPTTDRPYRDWTTEALRERAQTMDGALMGFAFQNLDIPEELGNDLLAMNEELARRERSGTTPPSP
jgi:hypothetical protein